VNAAEASGSVACAPQPAVPLYAERRGDAARSLVLLHGWALNLRVFDALAAALARDFTVIALDLPGHGRSPEPGSLAREGWTLERLAALAAPQLPRGALVLGWSLGGQLALQLARAAPERVAALVLVSTTPRFVAGDGWAHGVAPSVLAHFASHLGGDYRATVHDFLELQVRGSRDAAAALAALQAALFAQGEASPDVLARSLEVLRHSDLRAALPAIDVPALVIGGQYDRVTPPGAARALAAALPRARHHELARCGHAPFLTHEAEFGALLREFAASLPAAGTAMAATAPGTATEPHR
jgi:pimeloyl-[acyl-carrier protein] methyl ester esterase